MHKILVSACLLGEPVRYNGADKFCDDALMQQWVRDGRVVPVCPEIAGGLGVPRLPAEIVNGAVIDRDGRDVTANFEDGARHALELARMNGVQVAVLKEGSPSCGSSYTYDGTFTSTRVAGRAGVTTALLREHGIRVFSEHEVAEADALLKELDAR